MDLISLTETACTVDILVESGHCCLPIGPRENGLRVAGCWYRVNHEIIATGAIAGQCENALYRKTEMEEHSNKSTR